MSTVTPSEGYRDYSSRIQELETELREADARQQKRNDERVKSLEEAQARDRRALEDSYTKTIQNVKNSTQSLLDSDKANQKHEADDRKRDIYDRYGRVRSGELEEMQAGQKRALDDITRQRAELDRRNRDYSAYSDQKSQQLATEADRKLTNAVDQARYAANDTLEKNKQMAMAVDQDRQHNSLDQYQQLSEEMDKQRVAQNKQIEEYSTELKDQYERKEQASDAEQSKQMEALAESLTHRAEKDTKALRDAHAIETRGVREQLKDMTRFQAEYLKDHANGRADAVREYQDEARATARIGVDAEREQINAYREKMSELDHHYNRLNDENIKDRDKVYTNLLNQEKNENRAIITHEQQAFLKNRDELVQKNQKDRVYDQKILDQQAENFSQQNERALGAQINVYKDDLKEQTRKTNDQIALLKADIENRSTSADTSLIPAPAEEALRQKIVGEYDNKLKAEFNRDETRATETQASNQRRLQEVTRNAAEEKTKFQQSELVERMTERNQLLGHVADTEMMRRTALKDMENSHQKQTDAAQRNFSMTLEGQRREYEELLQSTRSDAAVKLNAAHQQAEFESRMTQRAFSARQNELIRDYEKKLSDQKSDYDSLMSELKAQSDAALRESDKHSKAAMEEQSRQYEQRIAQMEQQNAEHERLLMANNQDELEKLKRSNALLIRKKS